MSANSLTRIDSQVSSALFVDDEEEIEFENRRDENLCVTYFTNSLDRLSRGEFSTHRKLLTFTPMALKYVSEKAANSTHKDRYTAIGLSHNLCFKMIKCNSLLVKTILFSYGFQQCSTSNAKFNLLWTSSQLKAHTLRSLAHWQRVNHFPRSFEMTRKDRLYGNIARARQQFGDAFDFIPEFYVTPKELIKFAHVCDQRDDYKKAFIMKPVASSRGNGIIITSTPIDIPLKSEMIISRYISNPYLIDGRKFDLRIYVLVTSFHPLTAYIYNEGLTRFASQLYPNNPITFTQPLAHLTNYSLNKLSDKFIRNERAEHEDSGHKWTLGALLRKLRSMGVDIRLLMVRIEDIILKTLLSVQGRIAAVSRNLLTHPRCCFELFGFDVLIDSYLKPWLLEVNLSPSLTCDSPLDLQLKSALICDVLTLADMPVIDRRNLETTDNHSEKIASSRDATLRYTKKLKVLLFYEVCSVLESAF
uniref:Tubulin--tyrosine ligase-like protein 5 n=1 Tax=Parascaris univalens TaxID=6257 RepID=A0A915CFM9_PARUN